MGRWWVLQDSMVTWLERSGPGEGLVSTGAEAGEREKRGNRMA